MIHKTVNPLMRYLTKMPQKRDYFLNGLDEDKINTLVDKKAEETNSTYSNAFLKNSKYDTFQIKPFQ